MLCFFDQRPSKRSMNFEIGIVKHLDTHTHRIQGRPGPLNPSALQRRIANSNWIFATKSGTLRRASLWPSCFAGTTALPALLIAALDGYAAIAKRKLGIWIGRDEDEDCCTFGFRKVKVWKGHFC